MWKEPEGILAVTVMIIFILLAHSFYVVRQETNYMKEVQSDQEKQIIELRAVNSVNRATIEAYKLVFNCTETGKLLGTIKKRQKMCLKCEKPKSKWRGK